MVNNKIVNKLVYILFLGAISVIHQISIYQRVPGLTVIYSFIFSSSITHGKVALALCAQVSLWECLSLS